MSGRYVTYHEAVRPPSAWGYADAVLPIVRDAAGGAEMTAERRNGLRYPTRYPAGSLAAQIETEMVERFGFIRGRRIARMHIDDWGRAPFDDGRPVTTEVAPSRWQRLRLALRRVWSR